MQTDLPITNETLGQVCAREILKQRTAKLASGGTFTLGDIAKIIDSTAVSLARLHKATDIPPPHEAVTAYSASIGYPLDGAKWCDAYALKGWLVSGKAKMKDWKAAVRNWKASGYGQGTIALAAAKSPITQQTRDYSTI